MALPDAFLAVQYQWDLGVLGRAIGPLLRGLQVTIFVTVLVMSLSLPLGFLVALGRRSRFGPVRWLLYVYTELFRTTPILVQVFFFFFMLPLYFGFATEAIVAGVVALTFNVGAFVAEIFRGSIASIAPGQWDAALSTGMTHASAMRRVIVPQAARRAVPLLAFIWVGLFKDTSLIAAIGIREMAFEARVLASDTFRPIEILSLAAVIYFVLTYPQSLFVNWLFEKFRVEEE
jgi:polar amino acid transport system permease protein